MSTGMANLSDIENALEVLLEFGTYKEDITILHCNTEYPTPVKDVNLAAMNTIREAFKVDVGYSDHTIGIEIPIAAVALGARVIEKHFTLDKNAEGPDHRASLEPKELEEMVKSIRNIELGLGDGVKQPSLSEKPNIKNVRKSIVALRDIKEGELFCEENLATKRPGLGISPMRWEEVIGRKADRPFSKDDLIEI
jgi:N,N'-diacetyllegionaminate synthase